MLPSSSAVGPAPEDVLEISRVFEAPRALIFRLWSSPEHIVRWWGPEGHFLAHCEMDFREGGAWRFCMRRPDGGDHWISGIYREIAPPERLSFTYINDAAPFETLVELVFAERDGRTEMRFRQAPFPTLEERDGHGWGWGSTFGLLADYAAKFTGADGGPIGRPRQDIIAKERRG